jgi:hypothetical protein
MKKFLKNKVVFGIVISLAAMAVFSGIVYAATSIDVPGNVNVVQATNDIELYSDPACKYPLTSLTWPDLPNGGERTKNVYVKNVGNTDAEVTATLVGAPTGVFLNPDTSTIEIGYGKSMLFI